MESRDRAKFHTTYTQRDFYYNRQCKKQTHTQNNDTKSLSERILKLGRRVSSRYIAVMKRIDGQFAHMRERGNSRPAGR